MKWNTSGKGSRVLSSSCDAKAWLWSGRYGKSKQALPTKIVLQSLTFSSAMFMTMGLTGEVFTAAVEGQGQESMNGNLSQTRRVGFDSKNDCTVKHITRRIQLFSRVNNTEGSLYLTKGWNYCPSTAVHGFIAIP